MRLCSRYTIGGIWGYRAIGIIKGYIEVSSPFMEKSKDFTGRVYMNIRLGYWDYMGSYNRGWDSYGIYVMPGTACKTPESSTLRPNNLGGNSSTAYRGNIGVYSD